MLHIITDTCLQSRFSHFQLAQMAFEGAADVVQYRNKNFIPANDLEELTAICRLPRQPFQKVIINDDTLLALQVAADGVHLGQEDMDPGRARAFLKEKALIGATVHSLEELERIKSLPVDYIGVGPVFGTGSKAMALPQLGLEGLAEICRESPFPVVAIGNIRIDNAAEVLSAGAKGLAVISEFCMADDPVKIAKRFMQILAQR